MGDRDSQFALGTLYQYGGAGYVAGAVHPDPAAAAYWYQKASKKDSADASFALAGLYRDGLGVQKGQLTSVQLYTKAAPGRQCGGNDGTRQLLPNAKSSGYILGRC
jgi:TPR repeat protein